jgi:F-box-like
MQASCSARWRASGESVTCEITHIKNIHAPLLHPKMILPGAHRQKMACLTWLVPLQKAPLRRVDMEVDCSNDVLCDAILEAVFSGLHWSELCLLSCVCRTWRRVALRNTFWRELDLRSASASLTVDRVRSLAARAQGELVAVHVGTAVLPAALAYELLAANPKLAFMCASFTGVTASGVALACNTDSASALVERVSNVGLPGDLRPLAPLQLLFSSDTDWEDYDEEAFYYDAPLVYALVCRVRDSACPWLALAGLEIILQIFDANGEDFGDLMMHADGDLPQAMAVSISTCLTRFSVNFLLCVSANCLLRVLLEVNAASRAHFTNAGGLAAVVMAMHAHPDCVHFLHVACYALSEIATRSINQSIDQFIQAGVFDAVVAVLRAHPGHEELQLTTCSVLCCIALHDTPVDVAGGCGAVVTGMHAYLGSARVQEMACRALFAMGLQGAVEAGNAGAVEAAIAAMRAHPYDADVQVQGFSALWVLTFETGNLATAIAAGAGAVAAAAYGVIAQEDRGCLRQLLDRLNGVAAA